MDLLSNVLPAVVVLLVLFVLLNMKNRKERKLFQQVEAENQELLAGRFRGNPVLRRRFMRALVRYCCTEGGSKQALILAVNAATMAKEPCDLAACYYLVGCCYEKLENYQQAANSFIDACEAEPDMLIAQVQRARMLSLMRHEACIGAFETVLRLAPENVAQHSNYGMALLRLGRYEECEAQLKKAIEMKPDFRTPRELLVMLYDVMGETELAEAALRAAVAYGSDAEEVRQAAAEFRKTI